MSIRSSFDALSLSVLCLTVASPALGLASRVFVSARSGNDANACDNASTPCKTFQGALAQLNPNGEAIVLDSGRYEEVRITQGVTIEAPTGVTAFIHPSVGDAISVNAASGTVTLRGLVLKVLNSETKNGIRVDSVGTLNVENCFITGFRTAGIHMASAGRLNVKGTDITACANGILIDNVSGVAQASIDHCHLDGNRGGYVARTVSPGGSTTAASYATANNNSSSGWVCGLQTSGKDVINLEFCTGSENAFEGLSGSSNNAQSVARYSNCAFTNNGDFGVSRGDSGTFESRENNTITGNGIAPTNGTIGTFPAL